MLESLEGCFRFLALGGSGEDAVKPYPLVEDFVGPASRVRMPRAPRVVAPGGTMHVVARCNNREFYFTTPDDFALLLAHLRELGRTYEVTVYAYTLMSNHVHLLMQAPTHEALGRPLRWFMTETARAFHQARGRRGHFWERRYRSCLVEADLKGQAECYGVRLVFEDGTNLGGRLYAENGVYYSSVCPISFPAGCP